MYKLIFPIFFASLLSYLDTQIAGFALLYLIPTIMYAKFLDEHVYAKKIIPFILLWTSTIAQIQAVSWLTATTSSWMKISNLLCYNTICLFIFLVMYKKIDSYFSKET